MDSRWDALGDLSIGSTLLLCSRCLNLFTLEDDGVPMSW